ncbi:MAG: AAA family ATPase [Actinobacteria bacterium]|nr:AAA family ATPase [Actinomycetota bacterium]
MEALAAGIPLTTSALDARRGVVRLRPEVLDALGLRQWDAVALTGDRRSVALAGTGEHAPGVALLDDVTMSNVGLTEGCEVLITPVQVPAARSITVTGSALVSSSVSPETLRLALAGKVLTAGDAVSLLPHYLTPGAAARAVRSRLAVAIGASWTTELLTVTATDPPGPVAPHPSTVVGWRNGPRTGDASAQPQTSSPAQAASAPAVTDLVGAQDAARRLAEWFELTFHRPDLLRSLGASTRLGVAVHGPEGVGKATLVHAVARDVGAQVVELAAPSVAAVEPGVASQHVHDAVAAASEWQPSVLLITDIEALVPATAPPPLATVVLDALVGALDHAAVVVTTAHPESVDPRLRAPERIDRELSLGLPDARTRTELLRVLLATVPLDTDVDLAAVGERTPGFVAADLVALRREAAVRAALRHTCATGTKPELVLMQQDLIGALDTVRPISMSTSNTVSTGGLTLDDVGNMTQTKQALTEAVLWPLRYPDSFTRLGVEPPHGVLLYGPPGCGKTFLVRALAGSGALNVFSVKGAELLDKWVGESERAVRELFRRASDASPALIFLDEIDALAPRRGGLAEAGVSDRVVAALLTELDGVEPLRDVVVLGATNRPDLIDPALLRPGRLERLVYVPPPDTDARAAILRSTGRNTPLAADVNLDALAGELEGYSAADCAALIREAALTAMRESLDATEITATQLAAARQSVRPSLDPMQLTELARYAAAHGLAPS